MSKLAGVCRISVLNFSPILHSVGILLLRPLAGSLIDPHRPMRMVVCRQHFPCVAALSLGSGVWV
ncbi:hypothetical protein Holit_02810 [Hollandina sp. SP2]